MLDVHGQVFSLYQSPDQQARSYFSKEKGDLKKKNSFILKPVGSALWFALLQKAYPMIRLSSQLAMGTFILGHMFQVIEQLALHPSFALDPFIIFFSSQPYNSGLS